MSSIELVIPSRGSDLGGGFKVRRTLPSMKRRLVGPFIFFDHMGPLVREAGRNVDVRPHPHIGLSTVTYLYEGEMVHRDSLGTEQVIAPGAVNWMTSGKGIVHSERMPAQLRDRNVRLHGLQLWVALPREDEECEPSFQHCAASEIPRVSRQGVSLSVLAGEAYGVRSPVKVSSSLFYVAAEMPAGTAIDVVGDYEERAAYVVSGSITSEGETYEEGTMLVFVPGAAASVAAIGDARVVLVGGAKLEGERHIFWNFVSSSEARIEKAKQAWRERSFPSIPGDDEEFIPLPADVGRMK